MNTVSDVNECAEDTDDCAQVCIDIDLGYTCSCQSGYRLASDGRGCDGKARNLMHSVILSILCLHAYLDLILSTNYGSREVQFSYRTTPV